MESSGKTAGERRNWLASIVAGIVGIIGWIVTAIATVMVVVGGYAAMLWAATMVCVLTAAAVLMPPEMAAKERSAIVEAARADYAPLASADDGVSYAADQAVAGVLYARDGVDAGANWLLKKIGF
jgi:hypothetical protein